MLEIAEAGLGPNCELQTQPGSVEWAGRAQSELYLQLPGCIYYHKAGTWISALRYETQASPVAY